MQATMAISVQADYNETIDEWFKVGELRSWQSCVWGKESSRWTHGKTAGSFWQWLYQWASDVKHIQVYGWDMWRSWCVLGGTNEVSAGCLILDVSKEAFVVSNPPTIITCRAKDGIKNGSITFIDIANLGILKKHYDVTDERAELPAAKMAIQDYRAMVRKHSLGKTCLTAGSQAWHVFESRYKQPRQSPEAAISLEAAAYFGGRCECRVLGEVKGELYKVDVSAMYTSLGVICQFPNELAETWLPSRGHDNPPDIEDGLKIADVTIKAPLAYYPARDHVLVNHLQKPQEGIYGERVIYPKGVFRTALCGPELQFAIASGHVLQYHRVQYYYAAPLMAEWSKWALATRAAIKRDDKLRRLHSCFKAIINSLPGKWFQKDTEWVNYPLLDGDLSEWHKEFARNPERGDMTMFRTIAGKCQYVGESVFSEHSRPAVAAFWTSYGRFFLLPLLFDIIGVDDLFYFDTDGLIVNRSGLESIRSTIGISETGEPGKLRIVSRADNAYFIGIRKYEFGGEWFYSGPMPEEEEEVSIEEQLRKGRVGSPQQYKKAGIYNEYKHGIVNENNVVFPFVVGPKQ